MKEKKYSKMQKFISKATRGKLKGTRGVLITSRVVFRYATCGISLCDVWHFIMRRVAK